MRNMLVALTILAGAAGAAQAAPVFSEDFSGATPGGSYSGAIPGTAFTASGPDVDILGVLNGGFFSCVANPGGNCIDTVGNQGAGATVTSTTFALTGGTTYRLTFDDVLQGFSSGDAATALYTVSVGDFTQTLTSTPDIAERSLTFTPLASIADATLTFHILTAPDAVHGPVLSNIAIDVADAAVPEPASWAMFIGGFGLVGMGMRRRRTDLTFA